MEILILAWAFFKIGIISFGGGWTIVGLIQHEVLSQRWLSERTFADVVAIAQVTPGPVSLNTATLVGFRVAGIGGAVAASLSVVAFPMMAIALLTFLMKRTRLDERRLSDSMKVGTLPLIAMTLVSLGTSQPLGWHVWAIAAASCGLSLFTKIDPILMILASGAVGALAAALPI